MSMWPAYARFYHRLYHPGESKAKSSLLHVPKNCEER
jgi:hypothetical protein